MWKEKAIGCNVNDNVWQVSIFVKIYKDTKFNTASISKAKFGLLDAFVTNPYLNEILKDD